MKPLIPSTSTSSEFNPKLNCAAMNRRRFIASTATSGLLGAVAHSWLQPLALAVETPAPSKILFFETGATQWLFISGAFTWSQAMKMPTSTAITDTYGLGWLLAPMFKPADFANAAIVIKKAMGDLRGQRGPYIGVFQIPSSPEPSDGWANLNGSVPFLTWGKTEPNDAKPLHRNLLREKAFIDALRQTAQLVIDWQFGAGSAEKTDKVIDFVIGEISRPEDGTKHDDVAALWHEKDGTVVTADVHFKSYYPVLLSRPKPEPAKGTGRVPAWPKVNGAKDLADGMQVRRRSKLEWRWTGGARLGQLQIVNVGNGQTAINRPEASTPEQNLTILQPGKYLFRVRNITPMMDPWLEISFSLV